MKYITIFHANLNYAYLPVERYEYVIRASYEALIDTMRECLPDAKYVFEASGYTLEQIATKCPDVLEKLKAAVKSGQCEFMGGPYAHPMLSNFPKEDGIWSIRFANEVYQKYLGFQPKSFWNPEFGWRSYVAEQIVECGYKNFVSEFEAYSRSLGPDGKPLRPEIYEIERHDDKNAFYSIGFKYDLQGGERGIHYPFTKIVGVPDGSLRTMLRTDRISLVSTWYMGGREGFTFDLLMEVIKKYSQPTPGIAEEGALILFADDCEYFGTNGWMKLKYQNELDKLFEPVPETKDKLIRLVKECQKIGGKFITFDEGCNTLPPLPDLISVDDNVAWHGTQASSWANTPMAKLLRPWQDLVRQKLNSLDSELDEGIKKLAWFHLTNSYNSDGQWPPTLPDAPHFVHPFNYQYCFENLLEAELLVGGVDHSKLTVEPLETVKAILTLQQDHILKKAKNMATSSNSSEAVRGNCAIKLIERSRTLSPLENEKLLYPSEYRVRVNLMIEARVLVGGIALSTGEQNSDAKIRELLNIKD